MQTRNRTSLDLSDIWADEEGRRTARRKTHPSTKRSKKTPLPHPGQSYNPDPDDHKRLLLKIAKKERDHENKQRSINKAVEVKVDKKQLMASENQDLVSGIEHLIKNEDEASVESDCSDATEILHSDYDEKDFEAIIKDKTVVEKRKTKQQRLRQMMDKLQRKSAALRKLKNIRLSKFDGIKRINKELDKREKELALKKKKHKKIKAERLGQRFEPSDPIYCLPSELPKNLREVSCPMNSIVREQLESFQSRLLVEPTTFQVKKRKYKKRQYDRKVAAEEES